MFELLSKMYTEMKQGFSSVDKRLDDLESDVKSIKKDGIRIENDLKPKLEAALDGYKTVYERLSILEDKVDGIATKVEKQDVEIRVIKSAK